jgi:PiT family inorganic phosphate transporter
MTHFWQSMQFGSIDYFALPVTVLLLIALALTFDFTNGIHDAANSIATVVSTRVLSPWTAVVWAAFFNFVAFAVFHLKVAGTMGKGIIDPGIVDNGVIMATLFSACGWNVFTWYLGLPTSSSHALTFSLVGAGFAKAGLAALQWDGIGKVLVFVVLSPLIGGIIGLAITVAVAWLFRRATPRKVDTVFRRGQLLSAAFYSLGHGGNDAQKTMGIIFVLLLAASRSDPTVWQPEYQLTETALQQLREEEVPDAVLSNLRALQDRRLTGNDALIDELSNHLSGTDMNEFQTKIMSISEVPKEVPTEVVLACHLAMGLGTLLGGWRIVKTMGLRIVKLRPVDGFCAETGAATTLIMTIFGGIPVSTTHTITGAIVGVGSQKRLSAVRWGVAGQIVWAWVLTIPSTACLASVLDWLFRQLG